MTRRDNVDAGNNRIHRGWFSSRVGLTILSLTFALGIFILFWVGNSAPVNFVSERLDQPELETTSASPVWLDHIAGFERTYQLLYLQTRIRLPDVVRYADEGDILPMDGKITFDNSYNITMYGSPQDLALSNSCPRGCFSCPSGDSATGLVCDSLAAGLQKSVPVTCNLKQDWCSWAGLINLDFVQHRTYYWQVESFSPLGDIAEGLRKAGDPTIYWEHEFEVVHVTNSWTLFQMSWFYTWVAITLAVMFLPRVGVFSCTLLSKGTYVRWDSRQRWAAVLLVGLFFFNNPFFAAEVYSDASRGCLNWYVVAVSGFLCLLLAYWLEYLRSMGARSSTSSLVAAGGEEVVKGSLSAPASVVEKAFLGSLWIVMILIFIYVRVRQAGNPSTPTYRDLDSFAFAKGFLFFLVTVYICRLLFLLFRATCYRHRSDSSEVVELSDDVDALPRQSPVRRFLLVTTAITAFIVIFALYAGYAAPVQFGGFGFCFLYGICNLYVITLALCSLSRVKKAQVSVSNGDTGMPTAVNDVWGINGGSGGGSLENGQSEWEDIVTGGKIEGKRETNTNMHITI